MEEINRYLKPHLYGEETGLMSTRRTAQKLDRHIGSLLGQAPTVEEEVTIERIITYLSER